MKREPAATIDSGRRRLLTWLWRLPIIAALGGLDYGLREAYRVQFGKVRPNPNLAFSRLTLPTR